MQELQPQVRSGGHFGQLQGSSQPELNTKKLKAVLNGQLNMLKPGDISTMLANMNHQKKQVVS